MGVKMGREIFANLVLHFLGDVLNNFGDTFSKDPLKVPIVVLRIYGMFKNVRCVNRGRK